MIQDAKIVLRSKENTIYGTVYFHALLLCHFWVIEPIFIDVYSVENGVGVRYLLSLPMVLVVVSQVQKFFRPSDLAVALAAISPVLPAISYFVMHGGSYAYTFSVFLAFLAISIFSRIPFNLTFRNRLRASHVIAICLAVLVIVLFLVVQKFRVNSLSEILLDLYGVRAEVHERNNSNFLNYVMTWVYSIMVPFLILFFYVKQKRFYLLAMLGPLLVFFLVLTGKSIVINPFIMIAIYLSLKVGRSFKALFILIVGTICFSSLLYLWFDNALFASLFVRRTLFVPAMLNHHYYELFSNIGFVYYSHSVLSFLTDYPFQDSYQSLVGEFVFGNPLSHANTGIFGTGYMHFGHVGVVIFGAIFGCVLAFINAQKISKTHPTFVAALIALPSMTIFSSADLLSGMLTNGFLVLLAILTTCGNISQVTTRQKLQV